MAAEQPDSVLTCHPGRRATSQAPVTQVELGSSCLTKILELKKLKSELLL